MQRLVAHAVYLLALVVGMSALGSGISNGVWPTMMALASAVVIWWIAVGFGVRLGVTPDAFVLSVKRVLGFDVEWDVVNEPTPQEPPRRI